MRLLLSIIFFVLFGVMSIAQVTVSGSGPTRIPSRPEHAKMHYDSSKKVMYLFKSQIWYYQGKLIRAGVPSDSTYYVANVGVITISFTDAQLWNTNTNCYWYFNNGAWGNSRLYVLDSLFAGNNTWTGRNTFQDSLIAEKGLNSKGLITTKGLTSDSLITSTGMDTKGTATKSALKTDGVQANKVEIIIANKSLDGTSNVLLVRPSTADIELTLPVASMSIKGWTYSIKKDNDLPFFAKIKTSSAVLIKSIYSKDVMLKAECDGTDWYVY